MYRQTLLFLTLSIGSFLFVYAQSGDELLRQVEALETEALANIKKEQYAQAEKALDKAIELMPLRANLYYQRSAARFNREDYNGTYEDISKAIRLEPENPWYYLQKGILLNLARKPEDAIDFYNQGLAFLDESDTMYYDLLSARVDAKLDMYDLDGAIADADIVLAHDSTNVDMINQLAIALSFNGRAEESLVYFKKALLLEPENIDLIGNVGWGYLSLEQYDESLKWYNRMISLNPDAAYGYSNRGYLYIRMKDYKAAKKDLKKAIKLDPYNAYAYKYRALLFIALDDLDQACIELDLADEHGYSKKYGPEVTALKEKHCQ